MTKSFLALLLGSALVASAVAREPLPPTDEAAAAAVHAQIAGRVWSGRATVGDNTADIEITLAASGRSTLGAKENGGTSSATAIWAVTAAVAGGPFTVTIVQVAVDDKGRAKPDEAPVTIEATLAPSGHMVGTMTIEDETGAIDLTPR